MGRSSQSVLTLETSNLCASFRVTVWAKRKRSALMKRRSLRNRSSSMPVVHRVAALRRAGSELFLGEFSTTGESIGIFRVDGSRERDAAPLGQLDPAVVHCESGRQKGSSAVRHDALPYWINAFSAAITSAWCVASAKWPASSMTIRRFFGAETLSKYASTSEVGVKRSCRP